MKFTVQTILFLLLAVFCFFAGTIYDDVKNFYKKPVCVTVNNESEQPINSILVSYSGYETQGTIKVKPNRADKSTTVCFYQAGEGSFTLEAELANGKILRKTEGYIEAGYSFYLTLTPKEIKTR
jgi:hypothetical protein